MLLALITVDIFTRDKATLIIINYKCGPINTR